MVLVNSHGIRRELPLLGILMISPVYLRTCASTLVPLEQLTTRKNCVDRKSHSDQTEGVIKMDELIMLESMPPRLYLQQQADRPDEARLGFDALRLQVKSTLASPPRNCSSECSNLGHQPTIMY